MSTSIFDMRVKGINLAEWGEDFVINETLPNLYKPNVLFLFEILDFNPALIFDNRKKLNADLMYPIAWAYLHPCGQANVHTSRLRLQLYKYKMTYD